MSANDNGKPFEVFTGTAWQAETVKGMLDDNEIEAFFGDEIWGTDARWDTAPNNSGTVRVYVSQDDTESAKVVVERYYEDISSEGY